MPWAQNSRSSSERPVHSSSYSASARRAATWRELPYPRAPKTLRKILMAVGDCFNLRVSHDCSGGGAFSCWYGLVGPGVGFDDGNEAYDRSIYVCRGMQRGRRSGRWRTRCIRAHDWGSHMRGSQVSPSKPRQYRSEFCHTSTNWSTL